LKRRSPLSYQPFFQTDKSLSPHLVNEDVAVRGYVVVAVAAAVVAVAVAIVVILCFGTLL
jgi:hypothetical protein